MKIRKIMTNNKLLVRLIISYLITSILLTGILMGVVSKYISNRIKLKTTETAQLQMRQSYNTFYYALTDIYGDFYLLWSRDENISNFLHGKDFTEEEIKVVSKVIDNAAFRDEVVDSVYLFNRDADLIISNTNSPQEIDNFHDVSGIKLIQEFETYYESYKNEIFFPRKVKFQLDGVQYEKEYISIVYAVKDHNGKLNSGIMVNIDKNRLSSMLNHGGELSNLIIANSRGKIITDSQGISFGESLPRGKFYNSIANNPRGEDSFTEDFLGEKSFISYKKADNLGFVFISITPYSLLMKEVRDINGVIAGFFIIAILISLIVSIISTKKIYEPLNNLIKVMSENPSVEKMTNLDEYEFLDETFNSLIRKNKHSHAARIFNGNNSETAIDILELTKEKYLTLVIMPDYEDYRNYNVLEVLMDIVEDNTQWVGTVTSSDSISCIINKDEFNDESIDEIMGDLVNLQSIISDELDITVSIGVGTVVNSIESIRFSHRYAILAVNHALASGDNRVEFYTEMEDSKIAASQHKDSIADKIEKYILDNFHRQDFSADEIATEVDLSLGYIRQIFRSEKGVTLNDYIIMCRINKAKDLLINTEDTAKDISEAVGYYDNRYFYTLFKKKVGMTTEEFRKSRGEVSEDEAK